MSNKTVEEIRAEIERIKDCFDRDVEKAAYQALHIGASWACQMILDFIDGKEEK